MDIRVEKTRRSIREAFMQLRVRKEPEEMTVKELCAAAQINKSTFYVYYRDLYDLADRLETEALAKVAGSLPAPERMLQEPEWFLRWLYEAYAQQSSELELLFSGQRSGRLAEKLTAEIKRVFFDARPDLREDARVNVLLSYSVYGSYYAFRENRRFGEQAVMRALQTIVAATIPPGFPC